MSDRSNIYHKGQSPQWFVRPSQISELKQISQEENKCISEVVEDMIVMYCYMYDELGIDVVGEKNKSGT